MVRAHVGRVLSSQETRSILSVLEAIGRGVQRTLMRDLLAGLPREVLASDEYVARYLLLVAVLDQQAESPSARASARRIVEKFGTDVFAKPEEVMLRFDELEELDSKRIYRISPAIGRATTRFAWIVLRVGGFLIYNLQLNRNGISLRERLAECESPGAALSYLHSSPLMRHLLREKAARMYVAWMGHPDFGIDVSGGRWEVEGFPMIVNGHVGKVFARTGMLPEVEVESLNRQSERFGIVKAAEMRGRIERLVRSEGFDCVRVDTGAFTVGTEYCADRASEARCDACPLRASCARNMDWRAY